MDIELAMIKEKVQEKDHHNMIDDTNTAVYNNEDGNDNLEGAISDMTLSLSPLPPPIIVHINNHVNEKEDHEDHEKTIDGNTNIDTDTDANYDHIEDVGNDRRKDDEEERANFFLRCYDNLMTTDVIESDRMDYYQDGEHEENGQLHTFSHNLKSSTEDSYCDDDDDNEYSNNNESEDTAIEDPPNLLNNEVILDYFPRSLRVSNDTLSSLRSSLRVSLHRDPMVVLWFKLFKFANTERMLKAGARPYLIAGLFENLCDVRSDLEWAQDAAYRRQNEEPYIAWADYYAKERKGVLNCPMFISLTLIICTVTMVLAFEKNDWEIEPFEINPLLGPSPQVLLDMGALQGRALIEDGKWWLLVTPIFLHAGIIHLLLNALILIVMCRSIERNHGSLHTGILFIVSGMFGNMMSALLQPEYILVGASGGIYGLLGVCVADIVLHSRFFFLVLEERQQDACEIQTRKNRRREEKSSNEDDVDNAYTVKCRRRRVRLWCYFSLVFDLFLNSLVGLLPFVDNFAHLGGFLFGFFVSLSSLRVLSASSFDYRRKQERTTLGRWCHNLRILALRCGGGLSALFLVSVAIMFLHQSDGTTSPCPNCRYVSCIPLPRPWKPNDENNWWNCDGCAVVGAQNITRGKNSYNSRYFADLKMPCPNGALIEVDVSGEKYEILEQVKADLPDICREFCPY